MANIIFLQAVLRIARMLTSSALLFWASCMGMQRLFKLIIPSLTAITLLATPAMAEKRVALVIGNSGYVNVPRLANPSNDTRLMADTLRSLGFTLVGGGALRAYRADIFTTCTRRFSAANGSTRFLRCVLP